MLELSGVCVSYGRRSVLDGLSLTVAAGEIVVLIGANGSGKSTVLRTIAGLARPSGTVRFEGRDLVGLAPHEVSRMGVGYLLQGGHVFPNLTVRENVDLAEGGGPGARRRAYTMFPELEGLGLRRAGLLSGGQRQMLAIGMVMSRSPRLLLLDEPSAGLAPVLVGDMLDRLRALNAREGTAILLVEQNVVMALRIAGRVYRLAKGRADALDAASLQDEGMLLESLGVTGIAGGDTFPSSADRAVVVREDG